MPRSFKQARKIMETPVTEKCPLCKIILDRPDPDNLLCSCCKLWNPHQWGTQPEALKPLSKRISCRHLKDLPPDHSIKAMSSEEVLDLAQELHDRGYKEGSNRLMLSWAEQKYPGTQKEHFDA